MILPGEEIHGFREHIAQELERLIIDIIERSGNVARGSRRLAGGAELRIGHERRHAVRGKLNLRHNGDVPCRRVCHDLLHICLRVITAAMQLPIMITGMP